MNIKELNLLLVQIANGKEHDDIESLRKIRVEAGLPPNMTHAEINTAVNLFALEEQLSRHQKESLKVITAIQEASFVAHDELKPVFDQITTSLNEFSAQVATTFNELFKTLPEAFPPLTETQPDNNNPTQPNEDDNTKAKEADEVETNVSESHMQTATIINISEADYDPANGGPLLVDVALIEPGPGNSRDKNYYTREMLKRDSAIFEGCKMCETEHIESETNSKNWVSTVLEVGDRFTESGAPVASVGVHDPTFAQKLINLKHLGILEKMHCSIVAGGFAKEGEINGEKYNVVTSLTEAHSVDWVYRHGAGGRALNYKENHMHKKNDDNEEDTQTKEKQTTIREGDEDGKKNFCLSVAWLNYCLLLCQLKHTANWL